MKCLLINPGFSPSHSIKGHIQLRIPQKRVPLSLAYTASLLRENGFEVKIIDANTFDFSQKEIEKVIKKQKPGLTVITTTPIFRWQCPPLDLKEAFKTINIAKKFSQVAVVGSHGTQIPDYIFENCKADFVIRGEPELTALELAKKLSNYSNVKGISYKENNEIKHNTIREQLQNIDELPFPAQDLLPLYHYGGGFMENHAPFAGFLTSRGCDFNCVFCLRNMWKNRRRERSNENILEEMEILKKQFKVRALQFYDLLMIGKNKEKAYALFEEMSDRTYNFSWECATRVDCVDKKLLFSMKKAGCLGVKYGVESLSKKVLVSTGKAVNLEKIKNTLKISKQVGINFDTYLLFGLPHDDKETLKENYLNSKSTGVQFGGSYALPYPGTKLYEIALRDGLVKKQDWNQTEKLVGRIRTNLSKDLPTFKDLYFQVFESVYGKKFYLNPKFYLENRKWLQKKLLYNGNKFVQNLKSVS